MCRAIAVVYSDGVKGGVCHRYRSEELAGECVGAICNEGHASCIIDGKVLGAFSEDCVLQELSFILDDFVNFLDAKTESLDCLIEDAALFLRVWFLVCLTDKGGMSRFTLFVFA